MIETKAQRIARARRELAQTLARVGYTGKKSASRTLQLDRTPKPAVPTSDAIPGNGVRRSTQRYSGHEIAGIALNHKQAYEPIRRDNLQAAKESARMRRG